jgi:hypothetical protein
LGHEFSLDEVRPEWMRFNPHLNIVVEGAYLDKVGLAYIKKVLRQALGQPELIVHYEFIGAGDEQRIAKMLHVARYIVKPTFLRWQWDVELVGILKGIRSVFYWGTWKDEEKWHIEEVPESEDVACVMMLQKGECPACGAGVRWRGVVALTAEFMRRYVELGGGYWILESSLWFVGNVDGT